MARSPSAAPTSAVREPQKPVLTLVRTDVLRLEVQVPQDRIAAIHNGQAVTRCASMPIPSAASRPRCATSARWCRADSRALTVEAIVPNSDRQLRPGTFARAAIDLGTRQTLASVPAGAVLAEAGCIACSWCRTAELASASSPSLRATRSGADLRRVRPGERVVTSGLERLADGARVQSS